MYEHAYRPVIGVADRLPDVPPPELTRPERGTLATSALWLMSSNVLYAGCQWATLVALAKMGSASSLGYFGLALAVATPVVLITGFGLRAVQATDVQRRYTFGEYLGLRVVANVVAGFAIACAALAVERRAAVILLPIGAAKLAEATSETCYGLAQRHDRMRFVAISKTLRGALGLSALVVVVALGGTLATGAWAMAAAWTTFLVTVDLPMARGFEPVGPWPRPTALWRLARENAPLGAVNGVLALSSSLPRYLLQLTHGAAAVGYFTALSSIVPALDQVAGAMGHAAAPRLGWAASDSPRRYRRLVLWLLTLAVAASGVLAVLAMAGGRQFLALSFTQDYAAYEWAFVLVMLAGGLTLVNTVSYFALVASRRPSTQLVVQCLGLLVTGIVGAVSIPRLGVDGAALAIAAGAAAMAVAGARVLLAGRGQP